MKRTISIFLILTVVISLFSFRVGAEPSVQHDYSTTANSGIRHEACTTLQGTGADSYYTGNYTYEKLSQLDKSSLLSSLRTLMTSTHKTQSTYNQCRDLAVKTDCQNADGRTISLIYTSYVATWDDWCNNRSSGWNREHIWPKNLGGFNTDGPGADLHHIRPSDQPINSARGNKKYGNVSGGSTAKGAPYTDRAIGGSYSSSYFEPLDNVKGDVARICLYVYVRYGGDYSKCSSITTVFESVDVLLEWCALDPVDTWEMGRNEVVGAIQGNRNVFIDYPELAWLLFGREIPRDMTTPSGQSQSGNTATEPETTEPEITEPEPTEPDPTVCPHSRTAIKNAKEPNCTDDGYTGDTCCENCGELLAKGQGIDAYGHRYNPWVITLAPTATEEGLEECECDTCGDIKTRSIPATGQSQENHTVPPQTEPSVTEPAQTEPTVTEPTPTEPTVTEPTPTKPAVTDPPVTEPESTDPASTDPTQAPSGDPQPASFPWWIILVVILCCGAAVVIVIFRKNRNNENRCG